MKKITILALHLGYGGIERCISTLANSLIDEYEIEIISTYKIYDEPAFKIDDKVKIKYLINDKPNKKEIEESLKNFKIVTFIKEFIKGFKILKLKKKLMIKEIKKCNSDVIISTRDIHNEWLGKYAKKGILKIGWEHNYHNNDKLYINKIVKSVENLDYFVLVSKELKNFYEMELQNKKVKCVYIPNSLSYFPSKVSDLDQKRIISVGRLSKEKGYVDLIDVFSLVNQVYPDWKLDIVGDGHELNEIKRKINNKKLDNVVTLHGFQNRDYINRLLQESSIYVMCSHTESFGIVLLEAFSFGIPCIAFSSANGAKEIISNNWDGYLIDNRDKKNMAKKICELIANQNRRIIMGANGRKKADKYKTEEIKKLWIDIIK